MRAGGTVSGSLWLTRVRNLRPGDYVRVAHWTGELWMGGEPLMVRSQPTKLPKDYYDIEVQVPHDPKEWRVLCVLGDDQVQLAARDAVRETPVSIQAPTKKPRKAKPKRGEQMKLFGDD